MSSYEEVESSLVYPFSMFIRTYFHLFHFFLSCFSKTHYTNTCLIRYSGTAGLMRSDPTDQKSKTETTWLKAPWRYIFKYIAWTFFQKNFFFIINIVFSLSTVMLTHVLSWKSLKQLPRSLKWLKIWWIAWKV